jgi:Yip1 domain
MSGSQMKHSQMKPGELADREAEEMSAAGAVAARAWWGRVPQLLRNPVPVFEALRETDDVDVDARAEPITAIVILAGMAAVLLTPAWGGLLDNSEVDGLVVAVITFIGGIFYGAAGYFLLGLAVWLGARGAGADPPFRLARQLVAFASLPIALSLFVEVPLLVTWVGGDWFRAGGDDAGTPRWIVTGIALVFVAWAFALVAVGLRTTLRLPWLGVVTALALSGVLVGGLMVVPNIL